MVSSLTSSFFKPLFQRVSYLFKNTSYFIAVGQLSENIQEVYQSYQSAVIGLQQNFFLGSNSVSFAGFPESPEYRPDENFRRKLLGSVKQNDPHTCFLLLESLYQSYQLHPAGLISVVRENYYGILLTAVPALSQSPHCIFPSASNQQLWDVISSDKPSVICTS